MKRDYFSPDARSERRFGEHRGGTCMALIDGRFLIWLAQQGAMGATGDPTAPGSRSGGAVSKKRER